MTQSVHDPVETLQREIQTWDVPFVELDCFGIGKPERIAAIVNEFCRAHLGSNIRGYFFYRASVGSTHGIQLENGREVVIKVRLPPETNAGLSFDRESLEAIRDGKGVRSFFSGAITVADAGLAETAI